MSEWRGGSSSREEILGRVDRALDGVGPVAAPPLAPRRAQLVGPEALVELFAERVADYRATVVRADPDTVADAIAAALVGAESVIVPSGLSVDLAGVVPQVIVDDATLGAAELDRIDAVVTDATLGIAETGTIVLDHGPGQGRRAITLVPDVHVCLVRVDQVVTDVPDAVAVLGDPVRGGSPLTWISGPSATSDIELHRVEGVHGPRHLTVILIGPADR
ncbi:LutC/YkgG family protein [Nocardioides sp. Kera G14]|uniref:LutC/YkgG family protein n=1 Tax=Nocardioides sp. Kera G14 TaxID=2884264 RepID=UPI001D0FBAE9|nr:lactate utilization protein C [Nocardioides sp. Kera G14]UDY23266.1 lactate utilization protein C [Nocardioides sp. Kera G14]